MTCDDLKPLLHARFDDEIDPAQRADFDAHLKICPSCAADMEKLEALRDSIRDARHYYEAPLHLRNQIRFALRGAQHVDRQPRGVVWQRWGAAAAAVLVCSLISAPFLVNARNQRELVAEELLSAHERALAGHIVDVVSSDQHTVKPWFNGRLPFSPPVLDLRTEGFPLEGGRVDYAGDRPIAALVYSRRLHKIDVFVRPAADEKAPPEQFARNGYSELSWTRDRFLFTAISDLNIAEMKMFTQLLQAQ